MIRFGLPLTIYYKNGNSALSLRRLAMKSKDEALLEIRDFADKEIEEGRPLRRLMNGLGFVYACGLACNLARHYGIDIPENLGENLITVSTLFTVLNLPGYYYSDIGPRLAKHYINRRLEKNLQSL